ncbi:MULTISPECIES: hypothetical protein [unclassified Streptomyces]|uniref:hypothetical protein n=1 Tax=unclassified Streptomyces TaxID=2593676 RepID=UPI0004BD464E
MGSDRLHPLAQQEEPAAGIPSAGGARIIRSPYGHDGFLLEAEQVAAPVREVLDGAPDPVSRPTR